jgi:chromosome segregation ATPase
MIEPIMYIGIGFLLAGLLVIGVIPLVHARAVRLTLKRIEAVTPMSMAEIQADKDQLRAEFAMSTRRLEMNVEQMKAKTAAQLAEIGKKSEAVGRLKLELGEKTAALFELEAREQQLVEALAAAEQEIAGKGSNLQDTERALAEARSQAAIVSTNLNQTSAAADSQRVELMALRAQVEVFKGQVESYEKETRDLAAQIKLKAAEIERTNQQFAEERAKGETQSNRIIELERQLMLQNTETELLSHRVQELTGKREEQDRTLVERDTITIQLRASAEALQKTESELRTELADLENRRRDTTNTLRAEKAILENQLSQAQDEKSALSREIEKLKHEAETSGARERMENGVMRERISELAAEIARITSVLEGPGSPIDAILAGDTTRVNGGTGANGHGANGSPNGESGKGSLADRIRALQSRAPHVARPAARA